MEERQVSVDGTTYELAEPFMVVATANPVEMEGTYRLPEARPRPLPRPDLDGLSRRLRRGADARGAGRARGRGGPGRGRRGPPAHQPRADRRPGAGGARVYASPVILQYVVRLAEATRSHPQVTLGASPRAAVHLVRAAKANAALAARTFVTPQDIADVIFPVWRHRLHLTPQALSRGASAGELVDQVLRKTPQT
ncbi:MoxR family ATPase [Brachybacterium sp. GPGPB12]|uniref:AAA family ATPase n=1 Tax=Brachybacterium sp. GPGPB12 TaxID=3023517 RepID=UPI0031345A20